MKTARFIRLNHTLRSGDSRYPGNPDVTITPRHQFASGDCCNTFEVTFFNHNGTHIDFPNHFVKEGKSLADYTMDQLIFDRIFVLEQKAESAQALEPAYFEPYLGALKSAEVLLLKTGFQSRRQTADYPNGPYITLNAARWLREMLPELKCIGLDTLSITSVSSPKTREEGREVHRVLLGGAQPPFVIEDMDLAAVSSATKFKRFYVAPWFIERVDGGPCTVFAEL